MTEEQRVSLAARIEVIAGQKVQDAYRYLGQRREVRLARARQLMDRAWRLVEES